ncbi:MAG: putative glycosyltransferase [Bacteriovoracaceae bacterium]|nr:putative glycosyltransferase [Bacteriovoracaceae bacterium]
MAKKLRIFVATDTTPNAAFESNIWRVNLVLPLIDLGHDVIEFKYDLRQTFQFVDHTVPGMQAFIDQNRPKVSAALLTQIKEAHKQKPIDLFFSYFYDACVAAETIDEIKSLSIATMNWYCNGSYQMHLIEKLAPHYDWCLVPEKFRMEDYKRLGAKPIYCQEAANPNVYKPYDVKRDTEVSFVGQCYGNRPDYIQYLWSQEIDLRVAGANWQNSKLPEVKFLQRQLYQQNKKPSDYLGGVINDLQMIQMFSRSKINLGFSVCGWTHLEKNRILQIRLRDFEVPMSGGFYMVEWMKDLEEFFKIGEEIICYEGPKDLAEKIKYYLSHDSEREKIREAGFKRAQRDHTWQKRFDQAFKETGLLQ